MDVASDSTRGRDTPPRLDPTPSEGSVTSRSKSSRNSSRSLQSLNRLLGDERSAREWKELIQKLHDQIQTERKRAEDAEQRVVQMASHLKSVSDARFQAAQDVARLSEELKLYQIQFDKAQKEIYRAQDVVKAVDEERYKAQDEAAQARSTIRKLKEDLAIYEAREEGRRIGLQEGLRRGRELGYMEGRRMAEEAAQRNDDDRRSMEERTVGSRPPNGHQSSDPQPQPQQPETRTRSGSVSSQPPTVPPSRPPTVPPSRPPTVPPSRPPTVPPSRPPTVPPSRPPTVPPAAVPPPPPAPSTSAPIPDIPTMPAEPEEIHPINVRNASSSPRMPFFSVPPDNYIPQLGEDNIIRIPPPFEFSRLPPSPERYAPVLPDPAENEQPRMIPPPIVTSARSHRYQNSASPISAAETTMSSMDMLNDPFAAYSPMTAIPEDQSLQGTPHTDAGNLRRQSSMASQTSRRTSQHPNTNNLATPIYTRPRTVSGSSVSFQPPVIPNTDLHRTSVSSTSTTPGITIEPPSMSASRILSAASSSTGPARPYSDHYFMDGHSIPGGYANTSIDSDGVNQPSVIPDPGLYNNPDNDNDDEDAISSGMESMDSLTTPQTKQRNLPTQRRDSASASGSALGTNAGPSGDDNHEWAGVLRMASRPPIGGAFPNSSISMGAKTPSNKGRPLSRVSNKSRQ